MVIVIYVIVARWDGIFVCVFGPSAIKYKEDAECESSSGTRSVPVGVHTLPPGGYTGWAESTTLNCTKFLPSTVKAILLVRGLIAGGTSRRTGRSRRLSGCS